MQALHRIEKKVQFSEVFEPRNNVRRTKIIATIGPACDSVDVLVKLFTAGVSVARLNFSHGTHESKFNTLKNIQAASEKCENNSISVLLDTKGPEIRTGLLANGAPIELNRGEHLEIVTDYEFKGNNKVIACSYANLPKSVKLGDIILVADGSLTMQVVTVHEKSVIVEMLNSGKLGEKKNMNLPGNKVNLPTISETDQNDIRTFANYIDFVAVSFVQAGEDASRVRAALGHDGRHVKLIAKIENQEGLKNFDDILRNFDGIMVARGDLGMEIPLEKVFLAQKLMIHKCNLARKPVIVATQMLESMINNPRPTRAEATDVANAVLDGTDCVMLSGETANGNYPVEAVSVMSKICIEAESVVNYEELQQTLIPFFGGEPIAVNSNRGKFGKPISLSFAVEALRLQNENKSRLVVLISDNPDSAKLLSSLKPSSIVLFLTTVSSIARELNGLWSSICAVKIDKGTSTEENVVFGLKHARSSGWVKKGESALVVQKVGDHQGYMFGIRKC